MIPLSRGLEDTGGQWSGRIMLGLFGALVVIPLLVADFFVASGAAARLAPPRVVAAADAMPGVAAAVLVAVHFGVLALLIHLAGRGLSAWLLGGAVNRLRLRHLAKLYGRHRGILKAYFAEDEYPGFVVEVDRPGGGVPARATSLILGLVGGALLLEGAVLFAQRVQGVSPPGYAREACLGLAATTLIGLLLGDLDRLRARILVGLGTVGLLVVWGLRPELTWWGPGLIPALVVLLVITVVRVTRAEATTRVLFLTNKGLRLIRLSGDEIRDVHGKTLRPERLTLTPGNGESEWELFASGEAPLKVQPIGGKAQEIGVYGALHGFPVRVSGEAGAGSLGAEFLRAARAVVPLGLVAAWLVTRHWVPGIAALL